MDAYNSKERWASQDDDDDDNDDGDDGEMMIFYCFIDIPLFLKTFSEFIAFNIFLQRTFCPSILL